jgi:hypothetical protein
LYVISVEKPSKYTANLIDIKRQSINYQRKHMDKRVFGENEPLDLSDSKKTAIKMTIKENIDLMQLL